jgi:hypothetical protein
VGKKFDKKAIKEKESKIKVLAHELLSSTLSYLMLAPCDTPILQISLHGLLPCQVWSSTLFSLLVRLITLLQTGAAASLRWICLNHLKRCCTSFSSTGATPSPSRMPSFRNRSLLVLPQIHRSMCISATFCCLAFHLLVGQYSTLYNMVDRITIL